MKDIVIYADQRAPQIRFGIQKLEHALRIAGYISLTAESAYYVSGVDEQAILVTSADRDAYVKPRIVRPEKRPAAEGYSIERRENLIHIHGADSTGTMYALLSAAETVQFYGLEGLQNTTVSPLFERRGLKINLPYQPYDDGDPFRHNREVWLTEEFWSDFLDFMSECRYNLLSLWTENIFPLLFRPPKYPETTDLSDNELRRNSKLFRFILKRGKERGINTWLITWNIRITPAIASGLGLPEELGNMEAQYDYFYNKFNGLDNSIESTYIVRQNSEIIADYFRECIRIMLQSFPDLAGIGTNAAEEMSGSSEERHQWLVKTYGAGFTQSGRDIPFILRTNMSRGAAVGDSFFAQVPAARQPYLSFKYSNAHMYSHPEPRFEQLWKVWDGLSDRDYRIMYTLRNDDAHTLRIGDPDFISRYIKGLRKGGKKVAGYNWGADGYFWGRDFQHIDDIHGGRGADYRRHWYQFELIGRCGYQDHIPDDLWQRKFMERYGSRFGAALKNSTSSATRILCAVNRLCWLNYDYEWHPESLLSVYGFKSVIDIALSEAMPGANTLSIKEFVDQASDIDESIETPLDILQIFEQESKTIENDLEGIAESLAGGAEISETGCAVLDLKAWCKYGRYWMGKLRGALGLCRFDATGDEGEREDAVRCLTAAAEEWRGLVEIWARHYQPYLMTRTGRVFGFGYYLADVEQDIELVRHHRPGDLNKLPQGPANFDPDPGNRVEKE